VTEVAFDVLDALGGFATLAKRSPALDGAVPVRVAQGCVPLLEGNALGFQVVLDRGLRVRRRLGRPVVETTDAPGSRLEGALAAALPRLRAQGFLPANSPWQRRLEGGVAWIERSRVRVWTGLLVRPRAGVWLRVTGTANRRNLALDVAEVFVADEGHLVPLVVDFELRGDQVDLEGEVACVTPLQPGLRMATVTLDEAPDLGRAHAAFYDRAYFAAKEGRVTRKYRRLVAGEDTGDIDDGPAPVAQIAQLGPGRPALSAADRFLSLESTSPRPRTGDARALQRATFATPIALRANFDGHSLTVTPDAGALASAAREVERTWSRVFGPGAVEQDRRALWYLTKYVTPHPPGDPHFFVKPFAFTRTPPGWSSIVDGIHGDGYDVLRGVVSTDAFFATPAVFRLHGAPSTIRIREGTPLVHVIPVPRALLAASWEPARFLDEPARNSA
jgi:stage V sporulation protein SpoVS